MIILAINSQSESAVRMKGAGFSNKHICGPWFYRLEPVFKKALLLGEESFSR